MSLGTGSDGKEVTREDKKTVFDSQIDLFDLYTSMLMKYE